jgi:hypothetical protein
MEAIGIAAEPDPLSRQLQEEAVGVTPAGLFSLAMRARDLKKISAL